MCGRFTLTSSPEELALRFGLDEEGQVTAAELTGRYNVAPGQDVLAVRARQDGARRADALRWGLVPAWAKDPSVGQRMINARVETAATKPAFRDALRLRRCLVPANGFYEWADRGGFKQPYYIRGADSLLLAFAGLWEQWRDPDGACLESCTLLTTEAAPALRELHGRMPIVVAPDRYERWLDPSADALDLLAGLGRAATDFAFHPVSERVNRVALDDADCIAAAPEPPRQESLF